MSNYAWNNRGIDRLSTGYGQGIVRVVEQCGMHNAQLFTFAAIGVCGKE